MTGSDAQGRWFPYILSQKRWQGSGKLLDTGSEEVSVTRQWQIKETDCCTTFQNIRLRAVSRDHKIHALGKPLSACHHLHLGIAQIAFTPPPPHSNGHSGALFFRRDFTILPFLPFCLPFSLNKCPKPSGQGFRPPQNQANARLNLENSSLKSAPNIRARV